MKKHLLILLLSNLSFLSFAQDTSNIELKPFEITSSRVKKPLEQNTEVIRIISRQEIEDVNAENIGELLNGISGIRIENGTGSGYPRRNIVSLNGFPANYTLVLLNGSRMLSEHFHSGTNIEHIHVEEIERIEIMKGASSAQYGSDAIAGVVNIITRKNIDDGGVIFTSEAGSYDTYATSFSVSGSNEKKTVNYYSFSSHKQSKGIPIISPAHRVGQMGYTSQIFNQRLNATISPKITADFWVQYNNNSMTFKEEETKSHLFMPNASLTYGINKKSSLHTKIGYVEWFAQTASEHNRLIHPEVFYTLHKNKHFIIFGGDVSFHSFTRTGVLEKNTSYGGFFLQDNISINNKLNLSASIRTDFTETNKAVVSPKISFNYQVHKNVSLKSGYSRGFRAPSLQDLYEEAYGHGGIARRFGNPDLLAEYSHTGWFETGINLNKSLHINASVFYAIVDNFIIPIFDGMWEEDNTKEVWKRTNILQAQIFSATIDAKWCFLNNYYLTARYSYTDNTSDDEKRMIPYHAGQSFSCKFVGKQFKKKKLHLSEFIRLDLAKGRYAWSWKPQNEYLLGDPSGLMTSLADYHKLDAGITIHYMKKIQLSFSIENILGEDIEMMDDALMQINGAAVLRTRLRIIL